MHIEIRVVVSRDDVGRFHITSPNMPGLHLAGTDRSALMADLGVALDDLALGNKVWASVFDGEMPNASTISDRGVLGRPVRSP